MDEGKLTQANEDKPQSLIDLNRLDEITEIGVIDGGMWADVLAVSYGAAKTTIRIRFEESGNRLVRDLPRDMTLEELLDDTAAVLAMIFPYHSKPEIRIYRGRRARKWIKRVIARAEHFANNGIEPEGGRQNGDDVQEIEATIAIPLD